MKKYKAHVEIIEMFMTKIDNNRHFCGIIKRARDENDNQFVFSRITISNGFVFAQAPEQKELSKNLKEICIMVLDYHIHSNAGKYINFDPVKTITQDNNITDEFVVPIIYYN